ncbi:DUF1120 domain-containing protein [Pandoraea sputorum]|uniref:DUF1120 domain-containing protein n=1 Tax=Pandoraea sputorum TaxID=93222 RepID=A0A5E5ATC9_9BURK|nr:DUF1120 domain-containing protein [Pandoraea sputorum]VVE75733.1 hypothetical protein PSP31121_00586 [Pandoraea sputorum]
MPQIEKMKKFLLSALTVGVLAGFGGHACAAEDRSDIKVGGHITPGACDIEISGGGMFDYGDMTVASLTAVNPDAQNKPTQLGKKSLDFTMSCDNKVRVAFTMVDARSGSHSSDTTGTTLFGTAPPSPNVRYKLGLGLADNKGKIGMYAVGFVDGLTVDGQDASIIVDDGTGVWKARPDVGPSGLFARDASRRLGALIDGDSITNGPSLGKEYAGKLSVDVVLTKLSALSKDFELDGLATMEIRYL